MGDLELLHPDTKKNLTETLQAWFGNFAKSFHAIKIGRITGVDYTNQTVNVQVLHKMKDNSDPRVQKLRDYPPLQQVPFIVLGGGNGHLTFPIKVGDNCLLLFCDYEIDRWWDTGEPLPATYERRHNISDAFALVGVHSMADLIQGYSNYVRLQYSDKSGITIGDTIDIENSQTNVSGQLDVVGNVNSAQMHPANGASGTFTSADHKTITVVDGIITGIV